MIWFPFKKKKQMLRISEDAKERIDAESKKLGKTQVLVLTLEHNQKGVGSVLVEFADKTSSDSGLVRLQEAGTKNVLSLGELRFDSGNFYFYPNIDLEWEKTPRPEIHKVISNYTFTKEPIYLEAKDFLRLRPVLSRCFQREGVLSIYLEGNICQLEIPNLTKEKEEKISEDLLTYLSSLYESPWAE
ncbi:hypothetical protein [Leptospira vanthielii]|uniref:Uncharacterized protein n=1 Tax=Leptospira vanthielii serovar Holland str. Waz Holland = ATCC 700522 TaxID=1218591 RepID=N1WC10_9LEPT|nr:hypothetical protein [Leptospira vanthielii]EMY69401.1 hypothetical protein LEP1GSC199_1978 [Leptospira vanthielii serovar Holland str. Waz Holland = ATCC 700522]